MADRTDPISTPLATDAGRLARVGEVTAEVAARLRGVCAGLPDAEFAALVRQIAEVTVKYEARSEARAARVAAPEAQPPGPPPPEPRTGPAAT